MAHDGGQTFLSARAIPLHEIKDRQECLSPRVKGTSACRIKIRTPVRNPPVSRSSHPIESWSLKARWAAPPGVVKPHEPGDPRRVAGVDGAEVPDAGRPDPPGDPPRVDGRRAERGAGGR